MMTELHFTLTHFKHSHRGLSSSYNAFLSKFVSIFEVSLSRTVVYAHRVLIH